MIHALGVSFKKTGVSHGMILERSVFSPVVKTPFLCLPASRETPDKIRSMEVAAFLPWKACITGLCIVSAREPSFPANGLLM
jgi:hypothetical protein